jgi:NAD(P)-dependent dehydrogenase (short-subunit alcohol dehydrogenase family)
MAKPPALSRDGYEIQFATNHLGHALLVKKLLPLLLQSNPDHSDSRVVMVSSETWRGAPSGGIQFDRLNTTQDMPVMGRWLRYGQSKLANMLYARQLAKKVPGVLSFSITPGVVNTALVSESSLFTKAVVYLTNRVQTVEEGAHNLLWAVAASKDAIKPGAFYQPVGILSTLATKASEDEALAERLWEWTEAELERWMSSAAVAAAADERRSGL